MKSELTSTVVGELAARLRRDIALGVLEPGARLNIEVLKRERKVSHPSIREALALLAGEGYVSAKDNRGYRVLESSFEDLKDTTRLRAELEKIGLRWSIKNTNTDWRASVVAAHHTLSEVEAEMVTDSKAFAIEWDERNKQFHLALIGNCQSPRLIEAVSSFYDLTRRYRLMAYSTVHSDHRNWLNRSASEHSDLKDYALAGNAGAGCALLGEHVTKSVAETQAAVLSLSKARPR
ncbi:FCD domain-containing protein [uncultured Tateyamaria sp.]|uniref:GntR family transcriptional regulator n=1 Tax=uncultured Tateyamaria sp. TaxID=455651 RepID=UPI0026163B01|nr:FCD domain-containing protein [uncultured Tateyamaria sp.]